MPENDEGRSLESMRRYMEEFHAGALPSQAEVQAVREMMPQARPAQFYEGAIWAAERMHAILLNAATGAWPSGTTIELVASFWHGAHYVAVERAIGAAEREAG